MVIGILQPGYLPWLGYFEQLYRSDAFVIYDDVQYDKHSWRNRNRIKTANGIQWLSVPVQYKFEEHPKINQIRIDNGSNWQIKHFKSISQSYARAPYFKKYIGIFEEVFSAEWEYLVDLDLHLITVLANSLKIPCKQIVRSSQLGVEGGRIDRLVKICQHFNADTFYEGAAGINYIGSEDFSKHGITVRYQNYLHPTYNQPYGDFVPYLSIIDLLFNCGETSLDVLIGNSQTEANC